MTIPPYHTLDAPGNRPHHYFLILFFGVPRNGLPKTIPVTIGFQPSKK
jgi:hypothetical protein